MLDAIGEAQSNQKRFGVIEEGNLGDAWAHEAYECTPWLASNLDRLANVIGLNLELTDTEVPVDQFSADIVARNIRDDSTVLIENQLQATDHRHLGQILTYLGGLDAKTIIWIAADFHSAHLSAIKWLNKNTPADVAFFAVRLKVVRIGDSPLAPVFEILERPNDWDKQLATMLSSSEAISKRGEFRQDFWTHYFKRFPDEERIGPASASSNRWHPLDGLELINSLAVSKRAVGCFIRGPRGMDGDELKHRLSPYASLLQQEFGDGIPQKWLQVDMTNRENWNMAADWLRGEAERMERTLRAIAGGAEPN